MLDGPGYADLAAARRQGARGGVHGNDLRHGPGAQRNIKPAGERGIPVARHQSESDGALYQARLVPMVTNAE